MEGDRDSSDVDDSASSSRSVVDSARNGGAPQAASNPGVLAISVARNDAVPTATGLERVYNHYVCYKPHDYPPIGNFSELLALILKEGRGGAQCTSMSGSLGLDCETTEVTEGTNTAAAETAESSESHSSEREREDGVGDGDLGDAHDQVEEAEEEEEEDDRSVSARVQPPHEALPSAASSGAPPLRLDAAPATEENREEVLRDASTTNNKDRTGTAAPKMMEPFDSRKLREEYDILDGEDARVWDEQSQRVVERKVVSYANKMLGVKLPISSHRTNEEGLVVGTATQAFNVSGSDDDVDNRDRSGGSQQSSDGPSFPGWMAGNLVLPPAGIKDAESVGWCTQIFIVGADAQKQSLEVSLADPEENDGRFDAETAQRHFLSPGDFFFVPPGNVYQLINHSCISTCTLHYTIVKAIGTPRGSFVPSASH